MKEEDQIHPSCNQVDALNQKWHFDLGNVVLSNY